MFTHFNFQHSCNTFDTFYCAEDGCLRSFNLKNSFRKHLQKHILDEELHPSTSQTELKNNFPSDKIINIDNYSNDFSPESPDTANKTKTINPAEILNKSIANFIASLYANPIIPRNVIQIVVDGVEQIFSEGIVIFITNYVEQVSNKNKIPENYCSMFNDVGSIIENAFVCFKTEHKRFRYFAESESYVEPKEIIIGQRLNRIIKKGVSILEPISCTEQFIPLRNVLKQFFCLENVLSETLEYLSSLMINDKSVIGNFVQGTFWQSRMKKFNGKTVLPLFMYFDDFESNVLGSHSGVHKVGAVYVSIPCIPPHRTSVLSNIFLALLFHSSDRVEFGNNVIFNPLINELNYLQETGIEIDTPVFKGVLYFDLGLIIGDNLGIHSIIGFTESFSSNYSCRICTIKKNDLKFQCYEDESMLRSIDQYYMHLEMNDLSATGIKEKCVWLDVKNFNLFDQVGVDIMHDILEGCAKYIMGFIISYYVKDLKLFSLQVLNDRLFAFDFGPEKNKPCTINMDHIDVGNVKQSASEMLILVRYFGLIIGDLIPIEEPVWILFITLRKVLDIMLSPALEEGSIYLLKTLIAELNDLYLKYSNNCLKPKFHFLVHYPSMIKKFGPVSHIWAMRYEAKHRILKICARSSFNRRNLCLTLAIKHKLQLNATFYKGRLCATIDVGPRKIINSIKCKKIINELNLDSKETLFPVTWATVKVLALTNMFLLMK
ncbi:uncharacterized protein LOC111026502 [Myzus persicae]|uniref:uncharacterized protein LOC111026502 n=1 Tax=Myzus persicae TaxID=13164 RepID=UPI000B9393FE|nr:uncharacterized protein LOC111026502 [Myzus persicae]